MKFDENFTQEEVSHIKENYSWFEKYYGQLMGAVITNVSISFNEEDKSQGFLNLELSLMGKGKVKTELVCMDDLNAPGFLAGLPTDGIFVDNMPNIEN